MDEKTPWTTRYGSIAGLAELGHDVRPWQGSPGEGRDREVRVGNSLPTWETLW